MATVRAISTDDLDWFASLDPQTPDLATQLRRLWADGSGRPAWTLVAEARGEAIGRVAFFTEPLGCGLRILEGRLAGLWLRWDADDHAEVARLMLNAVAELGQPISPFIERRLNPELHQDIANWRSVLEGAGFKLFQEKEGFVWTDDGGPLPAPERLTFTTIAEAGEDAYATAMGSVIRGTLDRNDRYYLDACGPEGWGREMVGALEPGDEPAWLLAHEPDGTLAGYVAVGGFEEGVGTIVHIGVAPERRGRGYVNELLRAANRAARERGDRTVLSDVDTENAPMLAAMVRNGHRPGVRPWHVWAMRRDLAVPSR
jgi:ribosomal protein S18 acetylase RimI-like enzyme